MTATRHRVLSPSRITALLVIVSPLLRCQDPGRTGTPAVSPTVSPEAVSPEAAAQRVEQALTQAREERNGTNLPALAKALAPLRDLRDLSVLAEQGLLEEVAKGAPNERLLYLRSLADIACWLPSDPTYVTDLEQRLGPPPEDPRLALSWFGELARLHARVGGAEKAIRDLGHRAGFGGALTRDMALDVLASHGTAAGDALSGIRVCMLGNDPPLYGSGRTLGIPQRAAGLILQLSNNPSDIKLAESLRRAPIAPQRARGVAAGGALQAAVFALRGPHAADARSRLDDAGPSALPALRAGLQAYYSGNPPTIEVRPQVCELLVELGPDAAAAAPELWDALANVPAPLLPHILAALAAVGPWSPQPLPHFSLSTNPARTEPADPTASPGGQVIYFGRVIHENVDGATLTAIQQAADSAAQRLAMDPYRHPVALAEDLGSKDAAVRIFAADALRALGRPGYQAAPVLAASLGEDPLPGPAGKAARHHTALALTRVVAQPAAAVTAWGYLLTEGRTPFHRRQAATALGQCGAAARPFVPTMVAQLAVDDPALVRALVPALGAIGPAAAVASDALRAIVNDGGTSPALREAARAALARVGG